MNLPQPCADEKAEDRSKLDLVACLVIVAFLVILTWFGAEFHFVEMCYSTEYDRYVEQADQLLQGVLPQDPFHPLLYPALSAGVGTVLGNTFRGARSVSTFAAAGLLSITYLLGIVCFSRKTALLATVALALNSLVFMCGFEAATDMLFAFLGLCCMLLCVQLLQRPTMRTILGIGVCFALAYVTRYAAIAMLPCLILTMWWCPFPSRAKRLVGVAALAAMIVICLVPHLYVNTYMFGSPLYMRQGDNLARKVRLMRPDLFPATSGTISPAKLVVNAPLAVSLTTVDTARSWIVDGMAGFVGGNRVFLASALFTVALLGGLVACGFRSDRTTSLLLVYMASYFLLICVSMEPLPRLLLPILPVCMLIAVCFMVDRTPGVAFVVRGKPIPLAALATALFLFLLPAAAFRSISDMVPRHPYQELEAAQNLERTDGKHIVVAGTFPFMQRYVGYRYVHLTNDFGNTGPHKRAEYFRKLGTALKANEASYVIVGAPSLGSRPVELLTGHSVPRFLEPEFLADGLSVYRVLKNKL